MKMLNKQELVEQYEKYSDDEFWELFNSIHNYSESAKDAFEIVLAKKGGREKLLEEREKQEILSVERKRISNEILQMSKTDLALSFSKKMITSEVLSAEELNELIESEYIKADEKHEEMNVDESIVLKSALGGALACIVAGGLLGIQLVFMGVIFSIEFIGVVLLCYGIINLVVRKSYKNKSVLIATIAASLLAVGIGILLYNWIGYHG